MEKRFLVKSVLGPIIAGANVGSDVEISIRGGATARMSTAVCCFDSVDTDKVTVLYAHHLSLRATFQGLRFPLEAETSLSLHACRFPMSFTSRHSLKTTPTFTCHEVAEYTRACPSMPKQDQRGKIFTGEINGRLGPSKPRRILPQYNS